MHNRLPAAAHSHFFFIESSNVNRILRISSRPLYHFKIWQALQIWVLSLFLSDRLIYKRLSLKNIYDFSFLEKPTDADDLTIRISLWLGFYTTTDQSRFQKKICIDLAKWKFPFFCEQWKTLDLVSSKTERENYSCAKSQKNIIHKFFGSLKTINNHNVIFLFSELKPDKQRNKEIKLKSNFPVQNVTNHSLF